MYAINVNIVCGGDNFNSGLSRKRPEDGYSFCQENGGGRIGEGEAFFVETLQDGHVDVVLIVLKGVKVRRFKPDVALNFQGEVRAFHEGEAGRFAWNHDVGHACADVVDDIKGLLHLFRRGLIDEAESEAFTVVVAVAEIVQFCIRDDAVRDVDEPSFERSEADAAQSDLFDGAFRIADFDPITYFK